MRFIASCLCCIVYIDILSAFTLADKLSLAHKGDYLVTEQSNHYSLLLLKEKTPKAIVLEEITICADKIHLPGIHWEDWIQLGAPGHSAWIQYEIDPMTLQLIECYSYSKKGWLYLDTQELFLPTLLSLELTPIPEQEQRKVGLAPVGDELDRRPLWRPTIVIENKKTKIPSEVVKTYWPQDNTPLSGCKITLYFPSTGNTRFPIWIEASNGHMNFHVRGIHFGKGLSSPTPSSVPKRPLFITHISHSNKTTHTITFSSPSYYRNFSLFVFDLVYPEVKIGPIPFSLQPAASKGSYNMVVQTKELSEKIQKNHRYKWVLETTDAQGCRAESEDFFLWNR